MTGVRKVWSRGECNGWGVFTPLRVRYVVTVRCSGRYLKVVKPPESDADPGRAGRQLPRTVISANGFNNTSPRGSVAAAAIKSGDDRQTDRQT